MIDPARLAGLAETARLLGTRLTLVLPPGSEDPAVTIDETGTVAVGGGVRAEFRAQD